MFCLQAVHFMFGMGRSALHVVSECKAFHFFIVSIFLHVLLTSSLQVLLVSVLYTTVCFSRLLCIQECNQLQLYWKRSIQFFQTTLQSRFSYTLGSSFCWTLCVLNQSTVFPISLACIVPFVWSLAMIRYSSSVFDQILLNFNVNLNPPDAMPLPIESLLFGAVPWQPLLKYPLPVCSDPSSFRCQLFINSLLLFCDVLMSRPWGGSVPLWFCPVTNLQ